MQKILKGLFRRALTLLQFFSYLWKRSDQLDRSRYMYQKNLISYRPQTGNMVLDIGSGGDPFPYATVLADRFLEPSNHRFDTFRHDGKPVVICDIHALPFARHHFDYVVCSHVLEHVDDPIKACKELQRVGRAGYLETPTFMKDALFSWAKGMHKWHVVTIANRVVFFEYSDRQLEGTRSSIWRKTILGEIYHPLQTMFNNNQDIFNAALEWHDGFRVTVMHLDGTVDDL